MMFSTTHETLLTKIIINDKIFKRMRDKKFFWEEANKEENIFDEQIYNGESLRSIIIL